MKFRTPFKIVSGYHACTPIPRQLGRGERRHRLALVLQSYRPGHDDMYFDARLFLQLLEEVDACLKSDTTDIRIFNPHVTRYTTLSGVAALREFYRGKGEDDWEMPEEIAWKQGAAVVAQGFPEHWNAVGGPAPYADSFAFSIFTSIPFADTFRSRLGVLGAGLQGELSEVLVADHVP